MEVSQSIVGYYDDHVADKLRGFVEGNHRVERAWRTLEQWGPKNPGRIVEIGCGIGAICWRLSHRWPKAQIVGLDISCKSLEIAQNLFASPNLSFWEGPLVKGKLPGKFDFMVLMDVYEHIACNNRPALHEALKDLQSNDCRIFLSFPTPRHLAWLREHHPEQIQPVDEDISLATILALAQDTDNEVLLYQEVDVYQEGDYAHAVLGKGKLDSIVDQESGTRAILHRVYHRFLARKLQSFSWGRQRRLAMVHRRLGPQSYPGK